MNEKEMIEEMAEDIKQSFKKHIDKTLLYPYLAQDMFALGYRNCKDKVVLNRHEHQQYCAYKIIEPQIKGCLDRERELKKQVAELEEQRDRQAYIAEELIQEKHRWTAQARKETAKKIFEYFDLWLGQDFEELNDTDFIHIMKKDFVRRMKELAKQFGVEVEE